MRPETYAQVDAYLQRVAQLNGVPVDYVRGGHQFAATPEVDQRLREAVREAGTLLAAVNYIGVDNQQGQAIGLGATSTIAGRTDTSGGTERSATDPTDMTPSAYNCVQTNFDVALRYDLLDAWRHLPNFQPLWNQAIAVQMGLDMLMIGWHGVSAEADTDRVANPLLEDVNIGWLQKQRASNAARWLDEGATTGELRVGTDTGADYRNLDELAIDLRRLLHPRFKNDPGMVCLIGYDLAVDKYQQIVGTSAADAPTERQALESYINRKSLGGVPCRIADFFPDRALLITRLDNLSIYEQNGTRRRTLVDEPKLDRYADYQSVNHAYVVERYEAAVGCENITYFGEGTWTA